MQFYNLVAELVAKKYPEHVESVVGNDLNLVGYHGGQDGLSFGLDGIAMHIPYICKSQR